MSLSRLQKRPGLKRRCQRNPDVGGSGGRELTVSVSNRLIIIITMIINTIIITIFIIQQLLLFYFYLVGR